MNLLLLLSSLSIFKSASTECSVGQSGESTRNKCFFFLYQKRDFASAEKLCQRSGGHLASITSDEEYLLVEDAVLKAQAQIGVCGLWIGLKQNNESYVEWLDGTENRIPFNTEQPGSCFRFELSTKQVRSEDCSKELAAVCIQPSHMNYETHRYALCESGWSLYDKTNSCYKACGDKHWKKHEYSMVLRDIGNSLFVKHACLQLNAHLASIHSIDENNFIAELAMSGTVLSSIHSHVTIGLLRNPMNEFSWVDGSTVDFQLWAPGEPNNMLPNKDCVVIYTDAVLQFMNSGIQSDLHFKMWNDVQCSNGQRAGVCKKPATLISK